MGFGVHAQRNLQRLLTWVGQDFGIHGNMDPHPCIHSPRIVACMNPKSQFVHDTFSTTCGVGVQSKDGLAELSNIFFDQKGHIHRIPSEFPTERPSEFPSDFPTQRTGFRPAPWESQKAFWRLIAPAKINLLTLPLCVRQGVTWRNGCLGYSRLTGPLEP